MKILIQGLVTEYIDDGEGPIILFLHGWLDNLGTFDVLAGLLKAKHRVVRLDLPGFGKTELPPKAWNLDDYIRFVSDFISKLGIKTDIIIGHSFGGRIIIKGVASGNLHPQKIVLIGSAGIATRDTLRLKLFRIAAKVGKPIVSIPPFSFWKNRLRKGLYRRAGSDLLASEAVNQTFLNIIGEDLSDAAKSLHIPALLIWGTDDMETPFTDGKRLSDFIRGSQFEAVKGAGHFVHRENPKEVYALIEDFIYE